jgi:hypothetical protein
MRASVPLVARREVESMAERRIMRGSTVLPYCDVTSPLPAIGLPVLPSRLSFTTRGRVEMPRNGATDDAPLELSGKEPRLCLVFPRLPGFSLGSDFDGCKLPPYVADATEEQVSSCGRDVGAGECG